MCDCDCKGMDSTCMNSRRNHRMVLLEKELGWAVGAVFVSSDRGDVMFGG